jgi:hypothetical protein
MSKSGKIQDAASAALSAIEEALDLGAPPVAESAPKAGEGSTAANPATSGPEAPNVLAPQQRPEREAPKPAPSLVGPALAPANDDRRTIGELRAALQIPPNRSIMAATFVSIALWAVCWTLYVYFHQGDILDADGSLLAPKPILTIAALIAPVAFLYITGLMARRAHEMRLVANSMTEVAIRLIEPETIATEQVVALSQAIRREAASMGDGIERALARAGELEVIVRTEVSNLERSYTENERRVRLLIDELTREREAIVVNADNARVALFGARDALSQELAATSAHLAEAVSEAGSRVTSSLGSKGEEIKLALEKAGDAFETTLGSHGDRVVGAISQTGDVVAQQIALAGDDVTRRFNEGVADVGSKLQTASETLAVDFGVRGASIIERFDELSANFAHSIGEQGDRLVVRLAETGGVIHETISIHGGALDKSLAETTERLASRVSEQVAQATTTFETAEARLVGLMEETNRKAHDEFAERGQALHVALTQSLSHSAAALTEQAETLQQRFVGAAGDAVSALGAHSDRVNETLAERLENFERMVLRRGEDLIDRVSERGGQIEATLGERIAAFEDAVVRNSAEAAMRIAEHGDRVSTALSEGLAVFEESFTRQGESVAARVSENAERATAELSGRLAAFEDVFATRGEALAARLAEERARAADEISRNVEALESAVAQKGAEIAEMFSETIELSNFIFT